MALSDISLNMLMEHLLNLSVISHIIKNFDEVNVRIYWLLKKKIIFT